MPIWGWILLGVAGFLGLVWLRRYLVSRARERKLRRAQGNHRAMLLFYRYRKLCRILKAPVDEEMLALAKKATFSQHTLAPEELERMGRAVEETAAALNGSGFWKRICYRYILSVI